MLDKLPILALEKIVNFLDFESKTNLVASARENEALMNNLKNFEIQSPCPFCVLENLLTPERINFWRKMAKFSEDQVIEVEHKSLNFVLCNEIKVIDEECWQRIVPNNMIHGYWVDQNSEILTYEDMSSSGLLVDFIIPFTSSVTFDHTLDFENHIFEHFSQCADDHIGPINTKDQMYQVINTLAADKNPFVVPEFYDTNLQEDLQTFLIRIVASRYLAQERDFTIGVNQQFHNLDITKYLLDESYNLSLDIRLLSAPDIDLKYFVNNVRLFRMILHKNYNR